MVTTERGTLAAPAQGDGEGKAQTQSVTLAPDARRDFAVIVPAYNEAANAHDLVHELRATFDRFALDGEVVVVDDGSTDGTAERVREEGADWDRLKVISHRRNLGKTEALLTGAESTSASRLVLFDADLQHATDEIPRFLAKLNEGWDIVTGRKVGSYDKQFVSSVYNRLSRWIFKLPVSDTNSMKAFRREAIEEVRLRHDWHRFFVVLAYARGFTLTEIDIDLFPRRHGQSKYSGRGRIVVGLLDLMSVSFFLFFSRKPLLLFGVTGLILAAAGFLVGVGAIIMRIAGSGFRPLLYLVVLLELLGALLFGIGIVAELIAQQGAELEALERRIARIEKATESKRKTRGSEDSGSDD